MSSRWEQVKTTDRKGGDVVVPNLFRYIPSGIIYIRIRFGREGIPRLSRSTGETTLGKARAEADRLIQRHRNKHLGIDDSTVFGRKKQTSENSFALIAKQVLLEHTPTVRPATQIKHIRYINALVDEWGYSSIDSITVPGFKAWISQLRTKKFSSSVEKGKRGYRPAQLRTTFEGFSKHMNLVFRWAYENGRIKHLLVFPNPDKVVISKRKGRRYTDEELRSLWAFMNEDLRDQFVLASECFMRLSEALKLEWDRLDIKTGLVRLDAEHVKTGSKTGKGRTFYLSSFALDRMRARLESQKEESPFIFPSRTNLAKPRASNKTAWNAAKRRAGITGKATWHHLRHTALSRALLEAGIHPTKVSEYAGVHLVTIQKVYLHSHPEETKEAGEGAPLPILETTQKWVNTGRKNKPSKGKATK